MTATNANALREQGAHGTTQRFDSISNADFFRGLFPTLQAGEYCWAAAFAESPNSPNAKWAGFAVTDFSAVKDYRHGNGYYSVAILKNEADKPRKRQKACFSRLPVVVADDFTGDAPCTYRLETSAGKCQVCWKLTEPITDVGIAERLHKALAVMKLMPADASGNNLVRYVRLPVQINTKYQPHFAGELTRFEPEQIFTLEEVCAILGIDYNRVINSSAKATQSHSEPFISSGDTRQSDAELIANLCKAEAIHESLNVLIARYVSRGMDERAIREILHGLMSAHDDGTERYKARIGEIDRSLKGAIEKFAPEKDALDISTVKVWTPEETALRVPVSLRQMPSQQLQEAFEWISRTAEDTNLNLCISATIHLAACTVSRAATSNKFNAAALYIGQIARTGEGKNAGKNAVAKAVRKAFNQQIVSEFHSSTSIFSALRHSPACVFHLDEFGDKLRLGLTERGGTSASGFSALKEVYSQTHDVLNPATFSLTGLTKKQREQFNKDNAPVQYPHLNILAVTTPGQFHSAVTGAMVEGGLLNRFIWAEACDKAFTTSEPEMQVPEWLAEYINSTRLKLKLSDSAEALMDLDGEPDIEPIMSSFTFCEASMSLLNAFKAEIKTLGRNDEFMADMTRRWRENAMRVALSLHAFSAPETEVIEPKITAWAIDYVRFCGKRFISKMYELAQPSEKYGQRRKEYLEAFRKHPEGISKHFIGKHSPWRNDAPNLRNQIINDMVQAGDIGMVIGEKKQTGPAPVLYVALAS